MTSVRKFRFALFLVTAVTLVLASGCSKVARNTGSSSVSDNSASTMSNVALKVNTENWKPLTVNDRIRIGISSPITGDQAKLGQDMRNGTLYAVDVINAKGGIAGFRVQAVPQDDKHDPREAVVVANRFVADPQMAAVIGHLNSSCTIPAGEIYAKSGLLQVSPTSTNPTISHLGYPTFFRTCATDSVQAPSAADFSINKLGFHRFAILHDKTTYGEGLADQFRSQLKKLKVKELLYEGITQGDTDFNAVLSRVKSVKPDAVYFGGMYPEGGLLAKQAKEMGIRAVMLGADGIMDPKYIELGGKATENSYASFVSPSIDQLPTAAAFVKGYRAKYGEVGPYSPYSFDAAMVAMKAIETAIKKDGKKTSKGIEVPREAIIREMHALKDFPGVTGKVNFDKYGDPARQVIFMYQVKNGKWICVGPAR